MSAVTRFRSFLALLRDVLLCLAAGVVIATGIWVLWPMQSASEPTGLDRVSDGGDPPKPDPAEPDRTEPRSRARKPVPAVNPSIEAAQVPETESPPPAPTSSVPSQAAVASKPVPSANSADERRPRRRPEQPTRRAIITIEGMAAEEGTGAGVVDPVESASAVLFENGFEEGWDSQAGVFAVVASAGFPCGPDNPEAFQDCRNAAFQRAMLNAKTQITEFLAAEIESTVKGMYVEPLGGESTADFEPQFRAAKDLGEKALLDMGGQEAIDLLNASIDEPTDYREISSSDIFSSAVRVVARQKVAAVQCFRAFESIDGNKGRIAVVAILSPKSIALAKAMLGQADMVAGPAAEPLGEWIGTVAADGRLLFMHGVMLRTDENGELTLIAVGHASPRTDSERSMDAAYGKARLAAMQALRQYAGELVAASADMATGYDLTEFAERTAEFEDDSSYQEAIDAVAKKLSLPGVSQLTRNKLSHPSLPENPVATVVLKWNVASADAANELKSTLAAMRGSEGGLGRAGMKPTGKLVPPASPDGSGPSDAN